MNLSAPVSDGDTAGAASMELRLSPLGKDPRDLGIVNGSRVWSARTSDPIFIARAPAGRALGPGWYSLTAVLDGRSGNISLPQIYIPDAAGAYSEARSVVLVRKGEGYTAEFYLAAAVNEIRFDPSTHPCEFVCDSVRLKRIADRRRGLAEVLRSVRDRLPGAQLFLRRCRTGSRILFTRGPGALAETIRHSGATRTEERKKWVLGTIDKNGLGIEIGPSHDPIAPKKDGYRVHIIDHASREELLGKYKVHPIAHESIEEVDFIWHGQSYVELTGRPKHYDWIIASNLIEHTPDLVAFLEDCDSILKDDGVLSLVIPDKRRCFDRFRPITGLARILDSHFAGNKIHSAGAAAEYFMNVAGKAHSLSWDAGAKGDYVFIHSAQQALVGIREVRENNAYLDIHNWCFVPHSFRLLLNDLYALGFTKLREIEFHPTEGHEFYVTLGRHGKGPDKSRLEILRAIDAELAATDAPSRLVAAWRAFAGR